MKYEYGALCNNDGGVGELWYLEKNLSKCHSAHHKSHTEWLQIVPKPHKAILKQHNRLKRSVYVRMEENWKLTLQSIQLTTSMHDSIYSHH